MTDDAKLVTIAAIGLSFALVAGMTAHTRTDGRVRAELAECKLMRTVDGFCLTTLAVESEVADVCMSVVEQCRALVEGHTCSCWRAEP